MVTFSFNTNHPVQTHAAPPPAVSKRGPVLYLQVLEWASFDVPFQIPKKAQRIPELLTRGEVGRIVSACKNPKHQMLLMTCYGCGLRVSEVVALKVRHIDGERRLLRVDQDKGAKDRQVIISAALLQRLRHYWRL